MIPGSSNPLMMAAAPAAGAVQIERSLRFNSSDSAYLSRTPAVAGNRKTWTWAGWVKRSGLGGVQLLFGSNTLWFELHFNSSNQLQIYWETSGTGSNFLISNALYRDVSAWMHIAWQVDTTQATSTNRIKVHVNGTEISWASASYPALNYDTGVNATNAHGIGSRVTESNLYLSGYLADIHFIDGQALDATAFTEVSATTGQLIPKAYAGTYTGNSFWLKFNDNSAATATTLGKDSFLLGNNWTPNNLSVTAGAGNDSLVDTPTSYGTDTGVGGEVRGNYCTMNPLLTNGSACTFSNGNLETTVSSIGSQRAWATFGVSSGKWYFEYTQTSGSYAQGVGIKSTFNSDNNNNYVYTGYDGTKANASGSSIAYGATWGINDVIGVAFDLDNATITFYKNGASQGIAFTGINSGTYFPYFVGWSGGSGVNFTMNFGQRAFAYQTPGTNRPAATFLALCDTNLGAPLVALPSTVFNVITYTGTGSSLTLPNGSSTPTSISFTPDFAWIKGRSGATDHAIYDAVRGVEKDLVSNSTAAETTQTTGLTAFGTNTFTVGSLAKLNTSSSTYVAWAWDAGTTTVSNTAGSIAGGSQVRANVSAGFSIVTYTEGAANSTVGHGLGAAPHLIIARSRSSGSFPTSTWDVYHRSFGKDSFLYLERTDAVSSYPNYWGSVEPTSTVFGVSNGGFFNNRGNMVAYCFAPVVGYSSFGSYTGNSSTDGPFVYTGFRPRWILVKRTDSSIEWKILDTARSSTGNVVDDILYPDLSNAEGSNDSNHAYDFLSNGFKLRTTHSSSNASGGTYIYAAFAENPFQYARAR